MTVVLFDPPGTFRAKKTDAQKYDAGLAALPEDLPVSGVVADEAYPTEYQSQGCCVQKP